MNSNVLQMKEVVKLRSEFKQGINQKLAELYKNKTMMDELKVLFPESYKDELQKMVTSKWIQDITPFFYSKPELNWILEKMKVELSACKEIFNLTDVEFEKKLDRLAISVLVL